eukprot:g4710.t1
MKHEMDDDAEQNESVKKTKQEVNDDKKKKRKKKKKKGSVSSRSSRNGTQSKARRKSRDNARLPASSRYSSSQAAPATRGSCVGNCYARGYLVLTNAVLIALGSILIYMGSSRLIVKGTGQQTLVNASLANATQVHIGASWLVHSPFTAMLILGSAIFLSGVLGFLAAVCRKTSLLFCNFTFLLLLMAGLSFGLGYLLLSLEDAEMLISNYWKFIHAALPQSETRESTVAWLESHFRGSAAALGLAILFVLLGLISTSQLIGHMYTASRVMLSANIATAIAGSIAVALAFLSNAGGPALPYVLACTGIVTVLLSLLGILAVHRGTRGFLKCYFICLFLILLVLISCGIVGFTFRANVEAFLDNHWDWVSVELIGKQNYSRADAMAAMRGHLGKIGMISCVLIVMLLYSVFWAARFYCVVKTAYAKLEQEEVELARLEAGEIQEEDI